MEDQSLYRPQEMATQAHKAYRQHYLWFSCNCVCMCMYVFDCIVYLPLTLKGYNWAINFILFYSIPAGPAARCPLNFLCLINLKFGVRAQNGSCILQLRPNQSFVCKILSSQVPAKETKCLGCVGINFWNVLTPTHIIRDGYTNGYFADWTLSKVWLWSE